MSVYSICFGWQFSLRDKQSGGGGGGKMVAPFVDSFTCIYTVVLTFFFIFCYVAEAAKVECFNRLYISPSLPVPTAAQQGQVSQQVSGNTGLFLIFYFLFSD